MGLVATLLFAAGCNQSEPKTNTSETTSSTEKQRKAVQKKVSI